VGIEVLTSSRPTNINAPGSLGEMERCTVEFFGEEQLTNRHLRCITKVPPLI
jgi:hypothetical protein